MFPGARKLSSNTRKLLSVFIARMGSRPFATIAAAGTHLRGPRDLWGPARVAVSSLPLLRVSA